jgi:hypothetical protein
MKGTEVQTRRHNWECVNFMVNVLGVANPNLVSTPINPFTGLHRGRKRLVIYCSTTFGIVIVHTRSWKPSSVKETGQRLPTEHRGQSRSANDDKNSSPNHSEFICTPFCRIWLMWRQKKECTQTDRHNNYSNPRARARENCRKQFVFLKQSHSLEK